MEGGTLEEKVELLGALPAAVAIRDIMQDGDSRGANPILHWVMFNIPTASTTLEAGMTTPPAGSQYRPNYRGSNQAYLGPRLLLIVPLLF